jgi:hypothetical protein
MLAINCCVNTVVWVKNPGPIDELAIKKAAPKTALPAPKEILREDDLMEGV